MTHRFGKNFGQPYFNFGNVEKIRRGRRESFFNPRITHPPYEGRVQEENIHRSKIRKDQQVGGQTAYSDTLAPGGANEKKDYFDDFGGIEQLRRHMLIHKSMIDGRKPQYAHLSTGFENNIYDHQEDTDFYQNQKVSDPKHRYSQRISNNPFNRNNNKKDNNVRYRIDQYRDKDRTESNNHRSVNDIVHRKAHRFDHQRFREFGNKKRTKYFHGQKNDRLGVAVHPDVHSEHIDGYSTNKYLQISLNDPDPETEEEKYFNREPNRSRRYILYL